MIYLNKFDGVVTVRTLKVVIIMEYSNLIVVLYTLLSIIIA